MDNETEQNVTDTVTVLQFTAENNDVPPVYDCELFNFYLNGIFNSIIIILG